MTKKNVFTIGSKELTIDDFKSLSGGSKIEVAASAKKKILASRKLVDEACKGSKPFYGINTGFGYFANVRISHEKLKVLQSNILKSHASGWGKPLSVGETRAAMCLRLNVLLQGYTGVRMELCDALLNLINAEIYPVIPEYGSVGASGDLAPLAHLALPLIGEGFVNYKGQVVDAKVALKAAKLKPIELAEKEGLSLINGTQIMLSVGGLALAEGLSLMEKADKIAALSYEGLIASIDSLDPKIHKVRNQKGQIFVAQNVLKELKGSYLFDPKTKRLRVQDPYSLRCVPQVHGASRDALEYSRTIVERELNAVTDNPLVFAAEGEIKSGGNFHGQPIAMAFDVACMALAELGNISERRFELLMNPNMSGLNAFLTVEEGVNSGFMAAQYLSASLVNENRLLANPACVDSIPGNVGIEDHVSMGMTSARKLRKIVENLRVILAIEMLGAAQAIDLRHQKALGQGTKKSYAALRKEVTMLDSDRILANDINAAVDVVKRL